MPIYVDEFFDWPGPVSPRAAKYGHRWSHLWCDPGAEAELHVLAGRIGLKRSWYQLHRLFDHYDITPSKRTLALAAGAIPVNLRTWLSRPPADPSPTPCRPEPAPRADVPSGSREEELAAMSCTAQALARARIPSTDPYWDPPDKVL